MKLSFADNVSDNLAKAYADMLGETPMPDVTRQLTFACFIAGADWASRQSQNEAHRQVKLATEHFNKKFDK